MPLQNLLSRNFYRREVIDVARGLLGMRLVRQFKGERISGRIIETEAYRGEQDLACHAKAGRTPRTQVMYGPPGHAYVYFTYGMHWMLNVVSMEEGFPAAVLIRAVHPQEGLGIIAARRNGQPSELWCNGPGKICSAFGIDRQQNGANLCSLEDGIWIEEDDPVPGEIIRSGSRVGIQSVPEPWKSMPWRFLV